ncbi:MAG: adenosylmethionine--8-amino-7-oxononanoate transaminase [Spirochaetes bacterium]|nr:adenosylmethionine--8-amino-7-oxononanoate transaminase [Spirochaetota bacterium]
MIWHPFTPQLGAGDPLEIQRGDREYLYDVAGNEYIDAIASWWTVIHGHNHPQIVAAITEQLKKLDHAMLGGFTHEPALRLAERLLALTQGDFAKVFYSDNGSTAVEVMLKLAAQYWHNSGQKQKTRFIRFDAAYHGDTIGSMSVGGDSVFNRVFSALLFDAKSFAYKAEALHELDVYLAGNHETVAGIILEPLIAAAGGMVFQSEEVLRGIAALARKHGVLLLLDEVFTGMGRTGQMFAYQKAGIKPDLVALAKGLTGGVLPLAATLVTKEIHAAFVSEDPLKTFYHGHTMTGNPPGCAAALASLAIFDAEDTLARVRRLEINMRACWQNLAQRYSDKLADIRCLGAVSAADLVVRGEKAGYTFSKVRELKAQALAEGVILRPLGNVIYVTPPYNISDAALEKVFSAIAKILENYAI